MPSNASPILDVDHEIRLLSVEYLWWCVQAHCIVTFNVVQVALTVNTNNIGLNDWGKKEEQCLSQKVDDMME